MSEVSFIVGLALSTTLGYGAFHLAVRWIHSSLLKKPRSRARRMVEEAQNQQHKIREQKKHQNHHTLKRAQEELSEDLQSLATAQSQVEELLQARHSDVQREEHRMAQKEASVEELEKQSQKSQNSYQEKLGLWKDSQHHLHQALEQKGDVGAAKLKESYIEDWVQQKSLKYQKVLKALEAEMQASARKKAHLLLSHVHARYAPEFVWPKASHVIMENQPGDVERYLETHPNLIEEIQELSGCEVSVLTTRTLSEDSPQGGRPIALKFAGGFGIHREAAKISFSRLLKRSVDRKYLSVYYKKHLSEINQYARRLGKRAVQDLKLTDIHPQIQYLIGALNWRTSYRQNQWLHTMEVAVLAGLIAAELGLDEQAAKRCGLLHDIGKAIDYRIEGSHAIISGDYADRFGEEKIICDTVMSHHNDLTVESPLAFTLIAADTLSGARPGARVNLEEGYQTRLSGITETVKSFPGVGDLAIMNGGREVHVHVNHKLISEDKAQHLAGEIARKIEQDVSYPSQIKIQVSRIFESQSVA